MAARHTSSRSNIRRRFRQRLPAALEVLEPRTLLATFAPLPWVDDGDSESLRAAILAANNNDQDDTIQLSTGIYHISLPNHAGAQENFGATGDFDLTEANRTVTIEGRGAGSVIDGQDLDRVFQVFADVTVVLRNLTIRNGLARDIGFKGSTSGNSSEVRGGAMITAPSSNVTLDNVQVSECLAQGSLTSSTSAHGGALYVQGNLSATETAILGCVAVGGSAAGSFGKLGQGGGIFGAPGSAIDIVGGLIGSNQATGGLQVTAGTGPGDAQGGGVFARGSLVLDSVIVQGNIVAAAAGVASAPGGNAFGAGIFSEGRLQIIDSTIARNNAMGGNGGAAISEDATQSDFMRGAGGTAEGGGLVAAGNNTTVVNSQIVRNNTVGGDGGKGFAAGSNNNFGGFGGRASGGGMWIAGIATLTDVLVADNFSHAGNAGQGGDETTSMGNSGGPAEGGGLFVADDSEVALVRPILNSNRVLGGDGAPGSADANNGGPGGFGGEGSGGGIYVLGRSSATTFSMQGGSLTNNQAEGGAGGRGGAGQTSGDAGSGGTGQGGALFSSEGTLVTLTDSAFLHSFALGGAGGDAPDATSTAGNGGRGGHGIAAAVLVVGTASLQNCTLAGNSALPGEGGDGGTSSGAQSGNGGNSGSGVAGGGAVAFDATLAIRNSTVANNSAGVSNGGAPGTGNMPGTVGVSQPAICGGFLNAGEQMDASSTIFANNSPGDFEGPFRTASNNLVEDASAATGIADGVDGNIVGQDPKLGPLGFNGGPTQTFALLVGSPARNKGNNLLGLATDQRGFTRVSGGAIDIGAVEMQAPQVSLGGTLNYQENAAAIVLAAGAVVSDADSANFDGGSLTVTVAANASSADRLSIRNQGTAAGKIGIAGSTVTFGGTTIGTVSGGGGSTPLVVTFNGAATVAAARELVRNITFRNVSENPTTSPRSITFVLNDGDGEASSPGAATKTVTVSRVNDKPALSLSGTIGYVRDAAAITLAASAGVTDVDSPNFDGGRLRVRITDGASTANRLAIGSGFSVDANNNVLQGTTIIGKRVANGFGANELIITFNTNATPAVVQQLVRAITFKTVGGAAGQRKVIFTVSDGDGGLSDEAVKTVNVS